MIHKLFTENKIKYVAVMGMNCKNRLLEIIVYKDDMERAKRLLSKPDAIAIYTEESSPFTPSFARSLIDRAEHDGQFDLMMPDPQTFPYVCMFYHIEFKIDLKPYSKRLENFYANKIGMRRKMFSMPREVSKAS